MATVTFSIGTASRDYATITLWEADLDDDTPYDAADDAVGECYDDSAFDEDVTVDGGSTLGLNSITLTVASGEEHDGTAGVGARIVRTGNSASLTNNINWTSTVDNCSISLLEIDGGDFEHLFAVNFGGTSNPFYVSRMIVHNSDTRNSGGGGIRCRNENFVTAAVMNNIIYDIAHESSDDVYGIFMDENSLGDNFCYNNTVHNISSGSGTVNCYNFDDTAVNTLRNCIGTDPSSSGTAVCYAVASPSNADVDYCIASDTTASGSNSHDSESASSLYVSITGGSEDLHLDSGATNAIDGGVDLGTTPTGVNIDIDGRDRDAEGDTWDIGADEFVAAAVTGGGSESRTRYTFLLPVSEDDLEDPDLWQKLQFTVGQSRGALDRRAAFARHALKIISGGK